MRLPIILFCLALAAGPAAAQAPSPWGPVQPSGPIGAAAGTGAWPAIAEGRADAPGYTIYRPRTLPRTPLPLVLWGNGGCRDNGLSASHFLREVASHGYIVIANGSPRREYPADQPGGTAPPPPPPGAAPPPPADGRDQRRATARRDRLGGARERPAPGPAPSPDRHAAHRGAWAIAAAACRRSPPAPIRASRR